MHSVLSKIDITSGMFLDPWTLQARCTVLHDRMIERGIRKGSTSVLLIMSEDRDIIRFIKKCCLLHSSKPFFAYFTKVCTNLSPGPSKIVCITDIQSFCSVHPLLSFQVNLTPTDSLVIVYVMLV